MGGDLRVDPAVTVYEALRFWFVFSWLRTPSWRWKNHGRRRVLGGERQRRVSSQVSCAVRIPEKVFANYVRGSEQPSRPEVFR